MDNPETQAILIAQDRGGRQINTKNGQPRDTGNIEHKTKNRRRQIHTQRKTTQRHRQQWAQDTGRRQIQTRMTTQAQAILGTRHRTKTNK